MSVRIVQCLCPQRHCILAFAYEPGQATSDGLILDAINASAYLQSIVEQMFANKKLNPWCGIRGSRELVYEDRKTVFKTLAEANPHLAQVQEDQMRTREFFKHSRN